MHLAATGFLRAAWTGRARLSHPSLHPCLAGQGSQLPPLRLGPMGRKQKMAPPQGAPFTPSHIHLFIMKICVELSCTVAAVMGTELRWLGRQREQQGVFCAGDQR